MSLQTALALIFTVLASVCLVAVIILLGWFLIWKAFLSKFRLVRELLGQHDGVVNPAANLNQDANAPQPLDNNREEQERLSYTKAKKLRKD